jgi:dihydropyrimidinase
MPLLVKNGRVVNAEDERPADVYAEDDRITRVEPDIDPASLPPGTQVIDASGRLVFPGFIDPHVHVHLPVMGTHARDDHASASRAALAGGTTTIIEMICPTADDEPAAAFDTWSSLAEAGACCDYSFHLAVVRFDAPARRQLRDLVRDRGVASFKIFLAYLGLDTPDEHLFETLTLAKELGVIVTAHCENAVAIDRMQRRLIREGRTGPEWHEPSRPAFVEADGVNHLCSFAQLTGAHLYIVHTSNGLALQRALDARARGVSVWVESVVPHLVLDKSMAERGGFEGAKHVMSPPLREAHERDTLWNAIAAGDISTIATDHAPFDFATQKATGRDDFTKIPSGIPSIQERVDLVHTHGVRQGRIDLPTMVAACSTNAARLFGLYPRKGAVRVGSDADLVVYDPSFEGVFSRAQSLSRVDYNAYEGMPRRGRAEVVTLRGRVVARDGTHVGPNGGGRYLPRDPTHA